MDPPCAVRAGCGAVCVLDLAQLPAGHKELRPQDHRKGMLASLWPYAGEGAITKSWTGFGEHALVLRV